MSSASGKGGCDGVELVFLYALEALPAQEAAAAEAHIADCPGCREELASLRPAVDAFAAWPRDVPSPSAGLRDRLVQRIAAEAGTAPPAAHGPPAEPEWREAAPGLSCQVLAADPERNRVSMLVRLAPGAAYPPHRHAGVEELYLLDGELVIDDKKLYPGDYNRAEPGSADALVRSETGCTCVLITSTRDTLR